MQVTLVCKAAGAEWKTLSDKAAAAGFGDCESDKEPSIRELRSRSLLQTLQPSLRQLSLVGSCSSFVAVLGGNSHKAVRLRRC